MPKGRFRRGATRALSPPPLITASAFTNAPPTPRTFISTGSPTSLPFLGIAAERRTRDGADANSKFDPDVVLSIQDHEVWYGICRPRINCAIRIAAPGWEQSGMLAARARRPPAWSPETAMARR